MIKHVQNIINTFVEQLTTSNKIQNAKSIFKAIGRYHKFRNKSKRTSNKLWPKLLFTNIFLMEWSAKTFELCLNASNVFNSINKQI